MPSKKIAVLALVCCFPILSWAEDNSADIAMTQTQEVLRDPQKIHEAAAQTGDGKNAVDQVSSLAGGDPKLQKEIFELSSDVFGGMKGMTSEQMSEFLANAQKNPEEFSKNWTPEQQAKLKDIASRLPASQKSN